MDKNLPQKMIMQTGDWPDADAYRVACDCQHHDHDLDVWIEAEPDNEADEITLTFYKELYTPVWEQGFNRFREAFRVLCTGSTRVSGAIIMKRDTAQNLLHAIQHSIDRLEKLNDRSGKL